ncbi:MAG: hypothetical protein PUI48_07270 [Oscillospiraceae bacterium]|nr:hypothetical protein [Oscillospiraceae bacterium]MDY6208010.1 hypothetical protein [Oscillospiraceae bacterium]
MTLLDLSLELQDYCRLVVMEKKDNKADYKKVYDGLNIDLKLDYFFYKVLSIKPQKDTVTVVAKKRSMFEAILDYD